MRSAILLPVLGALVAATPQGIDFDVVDALPQSTSSIDILAKPTIIPYDQDAAIADVKASLESDISISAPLDAAAPEARGLEKRTACAPQVPLGSGPMTSPDTASDFLANPVYNNFANNATIPTGYTRVFVGQNAASSTYGYLGYTNMVAYDPSSCAAKCNAITGCASFNLYFERDPSMEPAAGCPNPNSTVNIKCSFWGSPVALSNTNNAGQWRANFQVVITGSNGYVSTAIASPPTGYSPAVYLGNVAINAPNDCNGDNTYINSTIIVARSFDPALCAAACDTLSSNNLANPPADGSPAKTCQFFNTYLLLKNGVSVGQYCAMYSEAWATKYATYTGTVNGTDKYTITESYSFTNASNPGKPRYACDVASATSIIVAQTTLGSFCSSLLGYTTPVVTVVATAATNTITTYSTVTIQARRKRAISTPAALATFAPTAVTSACSLEATPVTSTSTFTSYVTATVTTVVPAATVTAQTCYNIVNQFGECASVDMTKGGIVDGVPIITNVCASTSGQGHNLPLWDSQAWVFDAPPLTNAYNAEQIRNYRTGKYIYNGSNGPIIFGVGASPPWALYPTTGSLSGPFLIAVLPFGKSSWTSSPPMTYANITLTDKSASNTQLQSWSIVKVNCTGLTYN